MKEANKKAGGSKQCVARYCVEHIDEDKIPELFRTLISDVVNLCE